MDDIVDEITQFTQLEREEVKQRVWQEALTIGWNVCQDAEKYHITPHHYDGSMEDLYRDSHAFIFETMVYWARSGRQNLTNILIDRIQNYARETSQDQKQLKILILGDGSGNDSICLANSGFTVYYLDFPGSQNYRFVSKRFEAYGLLNSSIHIISNYDDLLDGSFDVVISIDVLEHLPNPLKAVADIAAMLTFGGIALISDAFGDVTTNLPTHLGANLKYHGATPFIFLKRGLVLTWTNASFTPMEFQNRSDQWNLHDWFSLGLQKPVLMFYLIAKFGRWKRLFKNWLGV
ncbi:methyltransferase domain-containing protein [Alkalinema sp. FACHB-956]|uniref:class I SAM-dependent methyltransferase n=1 Tax=Alkalinema sp. FACHB-956 TaxID=2692768 RepID=UPI001688991B|nr:methyltransferase domain-containing protein [Alkalinema sp. FACHB-956]MBD2329614.1 methyltransferase domain-containing protein [Alkalinema sp. FACHB-956]